MERLRVALLAILTVAIVTGVIALLTLRPAPTVITIIPPRPTLTVPPSRTPSELRVSVVGAVVNPGVVHQLPPGSRVENAVIAAGGLTLDADLTKINLAALLRDGEQINIPSLRSAGTNSTAAPEKLQDGEKIRINSATVTELQKLPGVGPAIAGRIIDYRNKNGPFKSLTDLDKVSGIGESRLAEWRDLIIFD
jgi:competence protein ComEA